MEKKYCPICLKEYETFPSKCTCGYDAFDKKDLLEDAQLFKIFKFAKQVYLGLISYDKSELRINDVACFDLEAFAANRAIKSCNSLIRDQHLLSLI